MLYELIENYVTGLPLRENYIANLKGRYERFEILYENPNPKLKRILPIFHNISPPEEDGKKLAPLAIFNLIIIVLFFLMHNKKKKKKKGL